MGTDASTAREKENGTNPDPEETCHGCKFLYVDKPRDGTGDSFFSCLKFHERRGVSVADPSGVTKKGRRFRTYTEMRRLWETMDEPVEVEPLVVEYVRRRERAPEPKTSDCKTPAEDQAANPENRATHRSAADRGEGRGPT